jgi:uncharacterized SAM-binding protein YcdF (DUF218 family)
LGVSTMLAVSVWAASQPNPWLEPFARPATEALIGALESRFEPTAVHDWADVKGLIVLGGHPSRLVEAIRLAALHPHLRVIFSGLSDYEMNIVAKADAPIRARFVFERDSLQIYKNTYGNAVFSTLLVDPVPGERWLLVTSASHTPRAMGAFLKAGFAIEPWPVYDGGTYLPAMNRVARHEWLGLIGYWLQGRTIALFPGPQAVRAF